MIECEVLNEEMNIELRLELGESNTDRAEFRVGEELAGAKSLVQWQLV